jgi:hypothetical protein
MAVINTRGGVLGKDGTLWHRRGDIWEIMDGAENSESESSLEPPFPEEALLLTCLSTLSSVQKPFRGGAWNCWSQARMCAPWNASLSFFIAFRLQPGSILAESGETQGLHYQWTVYVIMKMLGLPSHDRSQWVMRQDGGRERTLFWWTE